ncbi:MAG: alginate lyase family protein [Myxococcota bacterium]
MILAALAAAEPAGWGASPAELLPETRARVVAEADRALRRPARPVARLASAGSDDLGDPAVAASREAFEDADDAVLLALAFRATGEPRYRDGARGRLVDWAATHVPTGNPVDETRLDALIHARALLDEDDDDVRGWLARMRDAERAWRLGPRASVNNHRTHQLKMLLLLDEALGDAGAFAADRAAAEAHAAVNLDARTGESVDLRERRALYYHAYDLDAWLEIALLTQCCAAPVTSAWRLLERRLLAGDTRGEFVGSTEPLDAARANAGYGYGDAFDPRRATHALLTFHTWTRTATPLPAKVERRDLYALARYQSWTR